MSATLLLLAFAFGQPQPEKAVALLKQGIDAGDDFCLYLYARCLESGTGVKANKTLAREKYREAAEAGNSEAKKWCEDNKEKFDQEKFERRSHPALAR